VTNGLGGAALAAAPPPSGSPSDLATLRAALVDAGFTGQRVQAALRIEGPLASSGTDIALHERRLATAAHPLAGLVRLLVLGLQTSEAELPCDVGLLVRLGLADGELRPLLRLVPHDDLWIASDLTSRREPDQVAGLHRPSGALSSLTIRRPVESALDVGTGCGIQALLASRHAQRVVATDVNERALAFAEFSAALNGSSNIEFRSGSFFEPVQGERFDLVVSNPPYVISPETAFVFRDSGKPGDSVSADLVRELPAHLNEDAFGTILVSWIAGEDAGARPRSWLEGSGCDAWLVHTGSDDALTSAVAWNRGAGTEPDGFAERVDDWLAYYDRLGIERLAYGAVILRRRSGGRNWIRTVELPAERLKPASAQLERMFEAQAKLAEHDPLEVPLVLADGAFVDRTGCLEDGEWRFVSAAVRLETGIGFGVNLDAYGAAIVAALDGSRPLRPQLPGMARALGATEADFEELAERLVRHLVEHGIAVYATN
jgi:methylase of polypeptide subunit release factors